MEQFLILTLTVTGWVSISAFASLVWVIGLKFFAFTALIKKY